MSRRSLLLYVLLAGASCGVQALFAAPSAGDRMRAVYIRMDASDYDEYTKAIRYAENLGAVFRHRIYPYAAIGEIPESSRLSIAALPAVRELFFGEVPAEKLAVMTPHERNVAKGYNSVYFRLLGAAREGFAEDGTSPAEDWVEIDPGPLQIPDQYFEELFECRTKFRGVPTVRPPTSEFMLGHVAVGVIMPESDGVGSHDWAEPEEEQMVEEVLSAMNYWVEFAPEQALSFSYEINYRVPVRIEPLDRGGWTIEDKWAGMSLASLGFEGRNHIGQAYAYVEVLRERYDSDWAFLIFLLHGKEGQSFGSFLAYSYLGGPFNVNISANGSLGPENLDRVIAHETGHTFYTLDEYLVSPHDCSARSGYLNVENANKISGGPTCKLNQMCIMRGADPSFTIDDLPPCYYTRGQLGWWDTDEDGIPDVLDTDPEITSLAFDLEDGEVVVAGDTLFSTSPSFQGEAAAVPLINRNPFSEVSPRNVTIEPVSAEYRIDGGDWTPCEPEEGDFDGPTEPFTFTIADLAPWTWHTVEVRAVTAHGNVTPEELLASKEFFTVPSPRGGAYVRLASSNPARPPARISFAPVHSSGRSGVLVPVEVAVYDAVGRRMATLTSGDFETGRFYTVQWDGKDSNGNMVPAGVYLVGMALSGRMIGDKILVIP